jgi:hypothetical protein
VLSATSAVTTPITWPAGLSTGNALTRYCLRAAAMAANGVSFSI